MRAHGTRARYSTDRCRCTECKAANTAYNRRHDRRLKENGGLPPTERGYVALEPLFQRVASAAGLQTHELTGAQIAELCGVSSRTVARWKKTGRVREQDTDRIATRLGWHPAAIWGITWYFKEETDAG